ncbi:hypothetical protein Clacol_002418 [Clathrus columnatus]|uniref:Uncharacterized protein n=1 Tax=Clathrus columnatus TaxID=1419009 RepID=A0AAV5A5G4_9AGAM|nr:hypothetical protein Clacol_002418 [Clathrus columnatus]
MSEPQYVYSSQDNELQFLTDSAFSSLFDEPGSIVSSNGKRVVDGLFMERLESFIEGQLRDIESFANREQVPVDEAEPVADLYTIKSTLARLSNVLQLLHTSTGLDSLLLVVSPHALQGTTTKNSPIDNNQSETPASEASWIGGTETGKEFWMGLKGGGLNGARAFRLKSQSRYQEETSTPDTSDMRSFINIPQSLPTSTPLPPTSYRSHDVKTELYAVTRQALRAASGYPLAEMRWTKPTALEELYGVRLIGWPDSIGPKNPSNNTMKENKLLLDLFRNNQLKFINKNSPEWQIKESTSPTVLIPPSSSRQPTVTANNATTTTTNENELLRPSFESEPLDIGKSIRVPSIPTTSRPRKRTRPEE